MTQTKPKDGYVYFRGANFHYLNWGGDAPVLIALHGAGGNAHHWDGLAAALEGKMRVIALDQRGHGQTDYPPLGHMTTEMAEDVLAFASSLKLDDFNLLGHSMGSRISIVFAGKYSQRLHKLILSDPPHYPVEDDIPIELQDLEERPSSFPSRDAAKDYLRRSASAGYIPSEQELEDKVSHDMAEKEDGTWTWRIDRKGLLEAMKFVLGDIPRALQNINCPTLLLRGERSHLLPLDFAQHMARTIRNCKFVEIKDAGHGIWRDQPQVFYKVVEEFLLGEMS